MSVRQTATGCNFSPLLPIGRQKFIRAQLKFSAYLHLTVTAGNADATAPVSPRPQAQHKHIQRHCGGNAAGHVAAVVGRYRQLKATARNLCQSSNTLRSIVHISSLCGAAPQSAKQAATRFFTLQIAVTLVNLKLAVLIEAQNVHGSATQIKLPPAG